MTVGAFETHYAPGLGTKYAIRSWIVSAVIAAIGLPVTIGTFQGNPQWWVIPVLVLVFGFVLFLSVSAAVGAPGKWGSDNRLALRVDGDGITLPRVGPLSWHEISAIRIVDTGGIHASVWIRGWEALTGSSSNRFVTVWVKDADAVIARTDGAAASSKNLHPLDGNHGFDGVWAEGLRSPGWDETVAVLQDAASRHGVPLHGRKDPAQK